MAWWVGGRRNSTTNGLHNIIYGQSLHILETLHGQRTIRPINYTFMPLGPGSWFICHCHWSGGTYTKNHSCTPNDCTRLLLLLHLRPHSSIRSNYNNNTKLLLRFWFLVLHKTIPTLYCWNHNKESFELTIFHGESVIRVEKNGWAI